MKYYQHDVNNINIRTYKIITCEHGNYIIYINNRHDNYLYCFSSITIYDIVY